MRERISACIGFLVAATIPALVLGFSTPLTSLDGARDWLNTIELLPVWYFFTVLMALPIAIPAYLFARRYELIRWWATVITGLIIGALVSVLLDLHCSPMWTCVKDNVLSMLTLSLSGGLSGLVFFFVLTLCQ